MADVIGTKNSRDKSEKIKAEKIKAEELKKELKTAKTSGKKYNKSKKAKKPKKKKMKCWKCQKDLDLPSHGRIGFRATCDHCLSWLHCCQNCRHYKPGKPNDCEIPGTDPIVDRQGMNYCEDFSYRTSCDNLQSNQTSSNMYNSQPEQSEKPEKPKTIKDIEKKLFWD